MGCLSYSVSIVIHIAISKICLQTYHSSTYYSLSNFYLDSIIAVTDDIKQQIYVIKLLFFKIIKCKGKESFSPWKAKKNMMR